MELWLLVSLIPPIIWSFVSFMDKYLVGKLIKGYGAFMIFTNFLIIPTFILAYFINGFHILKLEHILLAVFSGALFIYCFIFYAKALEIEDTSKVIPLYSLIVIFSLIIGVFFLHEEISNKNYLAIFLIFVGSLILTSEKLDLSLFKPRKVLYYMSLCSFLLSIQFAIFKFLTNIYGYWTVQSYELIGSFIACLSFLLFKKEREGILETFKSLKPKSKIIYFVINDFLDVSAIFILRFALTLAPISLVSAVNNTQFVFIFFLGIFLTVFFPNFINEDISKRTLFKNFISIAIILVGVFLIS